MTSAPLNEALDRLGWTPTPIQAESISHLSGGNDGLIIAPTGSGKTMAAVLPLLERCLIDGWEGMSILYITPLRALNRDVDRRLQDIAAAAGLRVGLRHGDTSQSERQKQVRKPPNLMVTTPETFQVMFSGHRLLDMISSVQAVVIDEVHELAASERGWQLSLGLSRLETFLGRPVQRIGLSATVGNPVEVAAWLSPSTIPISVGGLRPTELMVECAEPDVSDEASGLDLGLSPRAHAALRLLAERIQSEAPCLVFVNSRNSAETVAQRLEAIATHLRIGVHHGSLAAETRRQMEDELRGGELDALVCTSSLELGIDVGSIAHVIQIRSPRSVDRMLQRVGRAEHHLEGTGRGRLISWESDDISESAVIARRALEGEMEPVSWRMRPISVVANQLVQMARCHGAIPIDEATMIISAAPQFHDWESKDTIEVLRVLQDGWLLRLTENPKTQPWWSWHRSVWAEARESSRVELPEEMPESNDDEVPSGFEELELEVPKRFENGWFSPGSRCRTYAMENLSMIPDSQSYRVRDSISRRSLGSVDEAFVLSLDAGGDDEDGNRRRFVMAGRTWEVIDADPEQEELLVAPVADQGTAPVWSGELPPTPEKVAREIGRMRHLMAVDIGAAMLEKEEQDRYGLLCCEELDASEYPMEPHSRGLLMDDILNHLDTAGDLPTDRCITIEARDEAIVVNSCQGSRINEALAHLIQAMASTRSGRMGRILVEPTRFSLQMGGLNAADVKQWLLDTPWDAVEGILSVTLPNSRQVRWRFAEVAKVLGVLRKGVDPRRINLHGLLKKYRGTIVMQEVLSRLFHERMDVVGAGDVLRGIQDGIIRVEITAPGAMGLSPRGEKDLLMPNWSNAQVRERLRSRLMNERAVLCCIKCGGTRSFRVARFNELPGECRFCNGRMLACAREGLRNLLEGWVKSEDRADMDRMNRCAEAIRRRGMEAVLCLMGRGIGETTTTRILRAVRPGDEDGLLEAIHIAEINYARTRRFWG